MASRTTTDHDVIREWIEARGGHPAIASATMRGAEPGMLRVDFGPPDESLEQIPWEEFFATFEDRHLAFLYQDRSDDGSATRFFKFVTRPEGADKQN
jgi:hypothetical protein